jgi:RNA polymerase sigma-70 factor, ECF subfamily
VALSEVSPSVARDRDLLSLMARGDESAFREFYGRHANAALALAFRVLRDRALAEDAVQEAFLAAWRQAGGYREERARPVSWLLTFVHRRAVDQVRRQQRQSADSLEPDASSEAIAEDEALTGMPTGAWIRAGLDRLSAQHREVLELAYFAGLTQTEIAEHLQTPLGTIKSRTSTALQRLNTALAA